MPDPVAAEKRRQLGEKIGIVLVSGLLYALSIAAVGVASREISPLPLVFLRLLAAAIVFCAILLWSRPKAVLRPRLALDLAIIGITNVGLPFLLLAISLHYISSSLASILFNVTPAMTVLLAHITLHDEKVRPATIVGTAIATAGALIILTANANGLSVVNSKGWIGQVLIILASAAGAFAIIYTRMRMQRQNTQVLAAGQVFACLLVFGLLCLLSGDVPRFTAYRWQAWAGVVVSAIAAPVLGFWLLFYIVDKYGATLGGFAAIATPLFSAIIGIVFLGEVITAPIALGALLLLGGIWSLNTT